MTEKEKERKEIADRVKKVIALTKKNGDKEEYIDALYQYSRYFLVQEKDKENGMLALNFAIQSIEHLVKVKTGANIWTLEKYCMDNNAKYQIMELYWKCVLLKAQCGDFECYMLYLEKNRPYKQRFYRPKKEQFDKIGLIQALQDIFDDKLDILSISMPPGTGKGEKASAKVLTPTGFTTFGELKVGDKVISGTGKVAEVLGIFPKPKMPCYKLTFNDGSSVVCSQDHIWHVQTRDDRRRNRPYRDIETKDMLKNFRVENGSRANYSIPYVPRIDTFEPVDLKIDPYLLGVLIGDGGLTHNGVRLTTPDNEILERITPMLPSGLSIKHVSRYDYGITGNFGNKNNLLKESLKEYGLMGKHSYEKYIPRDYLRGSHEQRLELLRGLLDTDGTVDGKVASYSTSSEQLAKDVQELVHSLGGYCSMALKTNCGYYNEQRDFVECRDSYRLTIQFSADHENPFWLPRKAKLYKPKRTIWLRYIENIERVEDEETICIYISDPSHLYITDDYIITHNTTLSKFFISFVMGYDPTGFNLFFSHSADICRMYYDGVYDIITSTEYTWKEIFPNCSVTSQNAKMMNININEYKPFQSLMCSSRGSEMAGKVRCNRFLMVDDLIGKQEEAMNKNTLQKIWDNDYTTDARQRKIDGCKEIHIATRWSVYDVIGHLENIYADNPRARFIAVPDLDEKTGESNFAYEYEGFSKEFFENQALIMNDITYQCLYKNQPIEREGLLYNAENLRYFYSNPEREPDSILAVCDTKAKGEDFMVMPILYQYGDDYYLIDCICDDSADFDHQYRKITSTLIKHDVQQCEIESNAGGDRLAYEVEKRLEEQKSRCHITTKPTETNKETRILVNSDWIIKHVLFRDKEQYTPKSDYGRFMNGLFTYSVTGKNPHDDVPDAMANFCLFVTERLNRRKATILKGVM